MPAPRRGAGPGVLPAGAAGGLVVAAEAERLPVLRHRQQLEAQPLAGLLLQAPDDELLRRRQAPARSPRVFRDDDILSDGSGSEEDEFSPEPRDRGDVEADAPELAARFPRTLRLSGLGLGELREALAEACAGAAGAARPARTPAADCAAASRLGAAVLDQGGPRRGRRRCPDPASAQEARRQGETQALRGIAAWSRAELRFAGLFARRHLGLPAWVARYAAAGRGAGPADGRPSGAERRGQPWHEGAPLELEVLVLPGGRVHFELSAYWDGSASGHQLRVVPPGSRRAISREAADHLRFFFNGDLDTLGAASPRGHAVLRAEADTLDMLFRSPASRPQFLLRQPRLQLASVRVDFEKACPAQGTAGQIYRHLVLRGGRATTCPEALAISCAPGAGAEVAGVYRRVATRGAGGAGQGEGADRPRRGPGPRGASTLALGRCPLAAAVAADQAAPLRLSRLHEALDADSDSLSDISTLVDDGESTGDSTDESEEDSQTVLEEWNVYCCPEKGILLYPLITRWFGDGESADSEDDEDEVGSPHEARPCPNSSARWIFARYAAAAPAAAESGGSSSGSALSAPPALPSLTKLEVRQALDRPLAWMDVPGDGDLAGTFDAAVPAWVPLRSAALAAAFSRDDDEPREVVVPRRAPAWEPARGREDAAPWWEVRCQVMQTSLRLSLGGRRGDGGRRRPGTATPSDVRAALPAGRWVRLTGLHGMCRAASTLRVLYLELEEAFQWPKQASMSSQHVRFTALPGPEHCQRVQDVPPAASGWCAFGGQDLWPLVNELVELAREHAEDGDLLSASGLNLDALPKAIQHEVRRSSGGLLELRTCVKPGLLLLALLASARLAGRGRRDPSALEMCFEWRLEDRRRVPVAGAAVARSAVPPGARAEGSAAEVAGSAEHGGAAPQGAAAAAAAAADALDPPFTLLSNHEDPEHEQPPRFQSFPLRSEQLRTLRWMCAAERSEDAFVFDREAVDEAAHLQDWRIRGRLRSAVRMRGGILADKVGYGKTATTIGLVECTRAEGAPRPPSGWGGALTPSRATLVLCPVNLITQWVREVQKFVAGGLRVIPLQTYAQLKRVSAQELADADVVVTTYRLFYSAPYLERLRQVACLQSGGGRGRARAAAAQRRRGAAASRGGPDGPVPAALRWPPREQLRMGGPDARRRHSLRTFSRQYAQVMSRLEGAGAPVLGAGGASWRAGAGGQPSKRMRAKGPADAASRQRAPSAHGAPERVPDAAVVGGGRPGKRMRGKGPREAAPRQRALGAHEAPERALGGVIAASAGRDAAARPARAATGKAGKACGPKRAQGAQGPPLLSCFHWKRLVLDEFHELLTRHPPAQVIVQSLSSKYRWGLSGTLPCKKTADVVKMAAFFGADLAGIKHRSQAPRAVCQQWLDHCARRNVAGLQELKSEEEIVLVRQHPAERALYLQLAHAASDLDLVGEEDAAALLSLRRRGQEGLVKLCSHFQLSGGQLQRSALDECDAVLQRRTRELASSRQAVRRALEEARALVLQLEPVRHLVDGLDEARRRWAELWSSFPPLPPAGPAAAAGEAAGPALAGGPAGETRRHLRGCLADAEASASAGAAAAAAGAPEPLRQLLRRSKPPEACGADALQAWRASKAGQAVQKEAAELHKRALQAVAGALRAMKTLEACARLVHFFDVTVRTARDEELMRCPICLEDIPLALRCVLPCAHLGCTSCVEEAVRRDARCPVCRASATPRQVMRLEAHLGADGGPAGECGRYGSKITKLLNFLASLQEREPSAKVILFVQWEDLKRKVAGALEESNMAFEHLRGGVFARQRTIERFQHEEGGSRVLLLSLEDSASGTNLTRANHVILFHPVVSGTREAAVACEMQAVGRALRAGQERLVKVWRFVTAGTVEQRLTEEHQRDLWERWQRRVGRPADGARG